jgi:alkylation response protein AidB-like acyl-CoA dehydrogenase
MAAARPPPRRSFVDVAAELGDVLRAASGRIEEARTLPPDLVRTMTERGLFRFWVPAVYGGPEITVQEGLDTFIELARHEASAAWCSFIANTTALTAANLSPEWAARIYGRADAITGGFLQPVGRAVPVDGGLVASGRWPWGSGTRHCTMVGGGCIVDEAVAPRADGLRVAFVFFDPSDVTFVDNWHSLGLRGSGSGDFTVSEAFVPEGRWIDIGSPEAIARRHVDTPLYRFSFWGLLAAGVGCTALGIAERAIEEFRRLAAVKTPQNSTRVLAERATAQADVARAEATVRSARAFVGDTVGAAWDCATRGDPVTVEHKRLLRLAFTDATQRSAETVARLYRTAGGEAVYERSPFEKLLRDVNTASQHAITAERVYELVGRLALGLDTDTGML